MSVTDERAPGFFLVDNEIVEVHGRAIGVYGVAVYAVLAQQAGTTHRCHPSITYIAGALGCSARQVRNTLRVLEAVGLIASQRRFTDTKRQTSSAYRLLPVAKLDKYTGNPPAYGAAPPAYGAATPRHVVPPNKNEKEQELRGDGLAPIPAAAPHTTTSASAMTFQADDPPPTPVPAPVFSDAMAAAIMDATGWTERLRNGAYPAWMGRCLGILGSASGDDVDAARAILASVVAHERWQYRPMARADQFPRFLASMVRELAAADPAVTATGAMLARRCGIDLAIAGAREQRAFEDIARAGLATGRTARELDAVIADARREPRFAACGIPAWRLRQGLAALPVAVAR